MRLFNHLKQPWEVLINIEETLSDLLSLISTLTGDKLDILYPAVLVVTDCLVYGGLTTARARRGGAY